MAEGPRVDVTEFVSLLRLNARFPEVPDIEDRLRGSAENMARGCVDVLKKLIAARMEDRFTRFDSERFFEVAESQFVSVSLRAPSASESSACAFTGRAGTRMIELAADPLLAACSEGDPVSARDVLGRCARSRPSSIALVNRRAPSPEVMWAESGTVLPLLLAYGRVYRLVTCGTVFAHLELQ